MAIAASDLIAFNCASRPEDDTSTGGGARDDNMRPDFTQLAADDDLECLSSSSGDTTQTVTIDGRDAAGAFITKTYALNGTTPVTDAQVFERVLSISMSADGAGIVTVRRAPDAGDVYAIPIGERGASALFILSASEGSEVLRYDKIFWLNNHGTLTLTAAKVQTTADPAAVIEQAVEASKDDSVTITNRKTAPSGPTFVADSVQQNVPGTTLEAAAAIGIWIKQTLAADNAPIRNTFTHELAGTST